VQILEFMEKNQILVIPSPYSKVVEGERGLLSGITGPVSLNVEQLRDNLANFVESMNELTSRVPKMGDAFRLDEIEFTVEVNAEGNFQLIGGAKAGITGGLTLKVKRIL